MTFLRLVPCQPGNECLTHTHTKTGSRQPIKPLLLTHLACFCRNFPIFPCWWVIKNIAINRNSLHKSTPTPFGPFQPPMHINSLLLAEHETNANNGHRICGWMRYSCKFRIDFRDNNAICLTNLNCLTEIIVDVLFFLLFGASSILNYHVTVHCKSNYYDSIGLEFFLSVPFVIDAVLNRATSEKKI